MNKVSKVIATRSFINAIKKLKKDHKKQVIEELYSVVKDLTEFKISTQKHNHPLKNADGHRDIHLDGGRLILLYRYDEGDDGVTLTISLRLQDVVDHKQLKGYDKYNAPTSDYDIDDIRSSTEFFYWYDNLSDEDQWDVDDIADTHNIPLYCDASDTELTWLKDEYNMKKMIKSTQNINCDMFGQDDGFFTKDDIMELAEEVEFRLQEMTDQNFRYTDVYMDGSNVHVEITTPDDEAFTVSARIDMRKIRKPSDILKYTESLVNQFLNEYHGLEASTSISCADDTELDGYEFVDNKEGYFIYRKIVDGRGKWMAQDQDRIHPPFDITYDQARGYEPIDKYDDNAKKLGREIGKMLFGAEDFDEYADEIQEIDQEFTSENTSINSTKLPAVFKMVSFEPGTINIDYGGGKFDNVADYLTQYDVINLVYDPYNRSKKHNQDVIKTIRDAGGADTATCSNVLNVIKEPEVRLNVLNNMKKLVKPGGNIYITVYEGTGKGDEGPTKSGYQLNRKTADYLEEIQQVFPDAKKKGKLITAINSGGSVTSATNFNYEDYYDEPYTIDGDSVELELDFDDDVIVEEGGYLDLTSNDYAWISEADNRGDVYDEATGVYLDDKSGIAEKCLDLLTAHMPAQPGTYHVQAYVKLVYDIHDVSVTTDYMQDREDESGYVSEDLNYADAEAEFNDAASEVSDVKYDEV